MEQTPRPRSTGTIVMLRYWLIGSGIALLCFLIWMIAPVLFLVLGLAAGLGLLSAIVVKLARLLEAWKYGGHPPDAEA